MDGYYCRHAEAPVYIHTYMSGPCAFTGQSSAIQSQMAFEKLVPWRITLDDKAQPIQNHKEDTDAVSESEVSHVIINASVRRRMCAFEGGGG